MKDLYFYHGIIKRSHKTVENPAHRAGLLLLKKPHGFGGLHPQTHVLIIHPRSSERGILAFSYKLG